MNRVPHRVASVAIYLAVSLAVLGVGYIDLLTGSDVHVVSLYFVPLALAGWRLGRSGAFATSLAATLVWLFAWQQEAPRHASPALWVANFCTQGVAFLTVSMLVALLNERLRLEARLRRTDSLTGLANRHGFFDGAGIVMPLCRRNARPVALAYLDLDSFKQANDRFGHAFGDALLRQCSDFIAAAVRASDIAARIGGDEFVVLLPEARLDEASAVLARVVDAIEASPDFRRAGVTASVGLVVDEAARMDILGLMRLADERMYQVKQDGKRARSA